MDLVPASQEGLKQNPGLSRGRTLGPVRKRVQWHLHSLQAAPRDPQRPVHRHLVPSSCTEHPLLQNRGNRCLSPSPSGQSPSPPPLPSHPHQAGPSHLPVSSPKTPLLFQNFPLAPTITVSLLTTLQDVRDGLSLPLSGPLPAPASPDLPQLAPGQCLTNCLPYNTWTYQTRPNHSRGLGRRFSFLLTWLSHRLQEVLLAPSSHLPE